MRIDSSNIEMESARRYSSFSEKRVSAGALMRKSGFLSYNGAGDLPNEDKTGTKTAEENADQEKNILQDNMERMNSNFGIKRVSYKAGERETFNSIRDKCMQYLLDILVGKKRSWDYGDLVQSSSSGLSTGYTAFSYKEQFYYEEQETTSFSTTGTVKCADGRKINFNLEMQMSREFSAYYERNYIGIQQNLCDPLVINLDSNIASLSDQKFFFDLDADGEAEEISMLGAGSGYLALDKNHDGKINDGSELFGTASGNGFKDLAQYDSDGNGWIDESDEIWDKLLIWTKDENGKDICYHLSEKNVGAICLNNAATEFSLNSAGNKTNGIIRKTGVFLYENGEVGTVQHLDVAN